MNATRLREARLTVEHLRSFIAVAEELNFRRAAEKLYLAPSPLSRRIKDVETAVGAPLFERDTRHVRLTPAGQTLLPLARDVLCRFDALAWVVRDEDASRRCVVRVGMPYGVHPPDRAAVLGAARRAAGHDEISSEPGMSRSLARRLASRELHVSAIHGTIDLSEFGTLLLREEEFGVMLPATHRLARQERVHVSELVGMRSVTTDFRPITPLQVRMCQLLEAAGVNGDPILADEPHAMTSLVASSTSFFALTAAGPGSPYLSFFSDPDVVIRELDGFDLTFTTYAAWLPERAESDPLVAAIVGELRHAFGSREERAREPLLAG